MSDFNYVMGARIDTTNADDFYNNAEAQFAESGADRIIFDAAGLEYISSAGLRSLLKFRKKYGEANIINVSDDVYSIFDVTGFVDLLTITKAYKQYSVEGCPIVGKGAKGTVYRYDKETVVKVYNDKNSLEGIKQEMELAKKTFVLGLPTAISYGVSMVGDKYASVFELIDADSVANLISKDNSTVDKYAVILSDLAKLIHSTEAINLDIQHAEDYALKWINTGLEYEDKELAEKFRTMVNNLPKKNTLIHGDYHANNVMIQNGETVIIDMDRVAIGHPIIELSGIYQFYISFGDVDRSILEDFLGFSCETAKELYDAFIKYYLDTDDASYIEAVNNKAALLSYVRLVHRVYKKGTDLSDKARKECDYYMGKIRELSEVVTDFDF